MNPKRINLRLFGIGVILAMFLYGCGSSEKSEEVNQGAQPPPTETAAESIAEKTESGPDFSSDVSIETNMETTLENEIEQKEETPVYDIIPDAFAYSMTVQINPLVELFFDTEDVVIGIAYLNQDAVDAYKELAILGNDLEASVEILVAAAIDQGYMKEDGTVLIEMSQVGSETTEVDTAVLIDSSKTANDTITSKMGEEAKVSVEIAVSEEVTEQTGVMAPMVCPDCNGTGNSCKECNGTGDVGCKRCSGGIESCGTCKGTAIIKCHGCHGSGTDGPQNETCNRCGGSGKQACDACNGAGTFSCSWCHGELHHICPECWNEGSCGTCGGDGIV